jgi:signal transduction histidine kinase
MAESGFVRAAQAWAEVDPVPFSGALPVRGDPYIIPIRIIEKRKHHLDLIEELLAKIPYLLGHTLSQEACMRIITVFSELCQNVLYYGSDGDGVRGYAVLQAFKGIVKFAVADTGLGIPHRLRRKYNRQIIPWDDSLAIALAMQPGVTTRPDGGGLGLHHAKEMVRKHNGILNIRSGSGKVLVCRGDEYPYRAKGIYRGPMYFWGTQIGIVLERP